MNHFRLLLSDSLKKRFAQGFDMKTIAQNHLAFNCIIYNRINIFIDSKLRDDRIHLSSIEFLFL